jgi:FkbM family methyltransferase
MAQITSMPLVKRTSGMLKEFVNSKDGQHYSFYFLPDTNDTNPASTLTFDDEEIIRQQYWYPFIKKDDIIFDIGAAFGSYCLPALAMGATVYAFSPEHEYPKILNTIAENKGFKERCHVYDFGFYSDLGYFKTDTAKFYNEMSQKDAKAVNAGNWTGWYIPVQKLDMFVSTLGLKRIDYIKIDTEGAEYEILKGAEQTLEQYKPKLLIEFHLFKDNLIQRKIHIFLEEMGYECVGRVAYTPYVHHGFYVYNNKTTTS